MAQSSQQAMSAEADSNDWQRSVDIQKGAYADLILVDGNPLDDIELMVDPHTHFKVTMKDGVVYINTLP